MAGIQLRFGTDEYKNAKAELQGYQTQLGSLTSQLQPCETNRDLQLQEYNDAVAYDGEYALAEENFASAEGELSQLNADMEKIEQSVKRNKDGEITSYRDANGDKIGNNDKATAEYDRQKSIIEQKIQTATHNREAAMQEKERIIQERNQKQLKETEVEKQEAETAEKELEELNQQINELNEKIIPLDEAIKQADEDKVDVAAQNNKNWDFYAEKELKAEGIENPSKSEIRARAEEIKQRNIELGNCDKDGNLIVGKSIVTLTGKNNGVADDMATAEEAVGQYNSAIGKEASKAIESALGQLSPEEKAAYNKLTPEQKSEIENDVLQAINKGMSVLSTLKTRLEQINLATNTTKGMINNTNIKQIKITKNSKLFSKLASKIENSFSGKSGTFVFKGVNKAAKLLKYAPVVGLVVDVANVVSKTSVAIDTGKQEDIDKAIEAGYFAVTGFVPVLGDILQGSAEVVKALGLPKEYYANYLSDSIETSTKTGLSMHMRM